MSATLAADVIPFPCPECAAPLRAAVARAGRAARCPHCDARLVVPLPVPEPPVTVTVADLEDTIRLGPPPA